MSEFIFGNKKCVNVKPLAHIFLAQNSLLLTLKAKILSDTKGEETVRKSNALQT